MLDTTKVVLEILQIALSGVVAWTILSLKAGRWLAEREQPREPLSVVPKQANGYGATEWRPRLDATERAITELKAHVDGGETRRADLVAENRREHDALSARIDRNEALLNAHQRRLDQLADRE